MQIEPYLFFDGRCEEALEFYRSALGAEIKALMRFSENPDVKDPSMLPPGSENKVMHSVLRIGDSEIMASDGPSGGEPAFKGVSLSIAVKGISEAERTFNALADGGEVQMPFGKTFWSQGFGMVADRFGVSWMVSVL